MPKKCWWCSKEIKEGDKEVTYMVLHEECDNESKKYRSSDNHD